MNSNNNYNLNINYNIYARNHYIFIIIILKNENKNIRNIIKNYSILLQYIIIIIYRKYEYLLYSRIFM